MPETTHNLNASPCATTEGEGWLMEFQPAPGSGEPRTVAYANRAKLDPHSAYLLDLDPDRFLHERVIMLNRGRRTGSDRTLIPAGPVG